MEPSPCPTAFPGVSPVLGLLDTCIDVATKKEPIDKAIVGLGLSAVAGYPGVKLFKNIDKVRTLNECVDSCTSTFLSGVGTFGLSPVKTLIPNKNPSVKAKSINYKKASYSSKIYDSIKKIVDRLARRR